MRRLLTVTLEREPDFEVVGSAPNGRIALQKITQVNPDVVTLDVEMPEMGGLETLRILRETHPKLPVIMFSAATRQGALATLDALAAGANDYVTKPNDVGNLAACLEKLAHDLVPRVRQFCHRAHHERPSPPAVAPPPPLLRPPSSLPGTRSRFGGDRGAFDLLCISTSTGGPNALADVFAGFKAPLPVPVAIVQHMPPMFTAMLAERLDRGPGPMHCLEATEGLRLAVGTAVLAPGGRHLAIARDGGGSFIAHLTDEPPENSCRPSADIMLRTAAATGARILSVVMTGMGHDGLRGCMHVHEAGGSLVIQDQASSVVWGMPGSVAASGLPHRAYPLSDLAAQIERQLATHPVLIA